MLHLCRLASVLLVVTTLSSSHSSSGHSKASLREVFAINKIEKIAFVAGSWQFGFGHDWTWEISGWTWEIYVMAADAPSAKLLQPANALNPAWSRDGSKLAFTCWDRGKPPGVCVAEADGRNRTQLMTSKSGTVIDCFGWSPDGSKLAYSATIGKVSRVFIVNLDGSDSRLVTEGGCPKWSPDGKRLVFSRYDSGTKSRRGRLWIANVDGSDARALTDDRSISVAPDWLPDGSGVIFASNGDGKFAIYSADMAGNVRVIARSAKFSLTYPVLSPDGKTLVCQFQAEREPPAVVVIPLEGTDITPVYVAKGGFHPSVVWKH